MSDESTNGPNREPVSESSRVSDAPKRLSELPILEGGTTRLPASGESVPAFASFPVPANDNTTHDHTNRDSTKDVASRSDAGENRSGKRRGKRDSESSPRSYYDVPMLQPPVWKWEIATYFWFGGISGGSYAIARMAERFGKGRYKNVTRAGTAVSFAAMLPCAPLLIHDLGDPWRFLYMLRVFKPKSPMNLGSWVLSGFGAVVTLAGLNQWRRAKTEAIAAQVESLPAPVRGGLHVLERFAPPPVRTARTVVRVADFAVEGVADAAGVPLALLLAGYTGILLSTSNTPLWARNNWLGPLFSASAISTGADAIQLALNVTDAQAGQRPSDKPLHQLQTAAKIVEGVALGGFLAEAGSRAAPVTTGKYAPHLRAAEAGLVVAAVLEAIPARSEKTRRVLRIAGAMTGLASGLALRWAISQGGHISGNDPQAARDASRPTAKP